VIKIDTARKQWADADDLNRPSNPESAQLDHAATPSPDVGAISWTRPITRDSISSKSTPYARGFDLDTTGANSAPPNVHNTAVEKMSDKDIRQLAQSLKEKHPFPADLSISTYISWLRTTLMSLGRRGNLAPFVN
jgi:hypothetical protein